MLVDIEYFLYESFGLEIFHTCNQHRDGFMEKIHGQIFFFNPWKGVKVGSSEIFSQLHKLVDFKYLF